MYENFIKGMIPFLIHKPTYAQIIINTRHCIVKGISYKLDNFNHHIAPQWRKSFR